MNLRCLTLALALLFDQSAAAQSPALPRFEIGGSLSAIVPVVFADSPAVIAGGGPRLALNITRSIGLQASVEALTPWGDRSGINGLYATGLKVPIRWSSGSQRALSLRAGVTGAYQYARHREVRVTRPDGSVVVYPGYRLLRATGPTTALLGLEWDRALNRRTLVAPSLNVLIGEVGGIAALATVAVSIGAGAVR